MWEVNWKKQRDGEEEDELLKGLKSTEEGERESACKREKERARETEKYGEGEIVRVRDKDTDRVRQRVHSKILKDKKQETDILYPKTKRPPDLSMTADPLM